MDIHSSEKQNHPFKVSKPDYGKGIRKLRAIMDLSQKELAVRLEMTQQNLSFLEQKEAWPDNLIIKVSEALNIPIAGIDYLATEADLIGSIIKHNTQGNLGSIGHINKNNSCYNTYYIGKKDNLKDIIEKLEELIHVLKENMEASSKVQSKLPED